MKNLLLLLLTRMSVDVVCRLQCTPSGARCSRASALWRAWGHIRTMSIGVQRFIGPVLVVVEGRGPSLLFSDVRQDVVPVLKPEVTCRRRSQSADDDLFARAGESCPM